MNLTQLDAAVQARGFSYVPPCSGAADPSNPILIALNSKYREINGAQRWPWLETVVQLAVTTAGMDLYPLDTVSDLRQLDAVSLVDPQGNHVNLTNMDPFQFQSYTYESPSQGVPKLWTEYAGSIQLWPAPDAGYQIFIAYVNTPPDLVSLTDVPVLPVVYHDVLVWGAVMELSFRERAIWAQELAQGYYAQRYKAMQDEYLLRQRQTSSSVEQSGYFDDYSDDWMTYGTGAW